MPLYALLTKGHLWQEFRLFFVYLRAQQLESRDLAGIK